MSRLRVLSISTLFPSPTRPAFGGFVARQMRAVAARGDVELVVINPLGVPPWPLSRRGAWRAMADSPAESDLDGVRVLHPRFTTIPLIGGDSNPARIARAVLPLARALHTEQAFDLVDAQFFFPDGPAAAMVARVLGLPLTIKARGSDIHYWGTRPRALAQMREAALEAAAMLAVSDALRRDMAALGMPDDRIAVHYTGLDHARFRVVPRAEARAQVSALPGLEIPPDGPLIVTPGALIPIKGQRLAIESLLDLPGVRLALAGSGPDAPVLKALVRELGLEERVRFLGQVGHDVLPMLFCAADAVVLPSEREGLANVWIEALASGTPLIIPDVGGAREVVTSPSAGRIVGRNPQAIAKGVVNLLANPPSQADVAAHAARFSWETNARELAAHWRRAAARA